jgi:hypothetical protein
MTPSQRFNIRQSIAKLPVIGPAAKKLYRAIVPRSPDLRFGSSPQYWDDRYTLGGNSGAGSYGRLARFKAEVISKFVTDNGIRTVIEFGSGDGAQLELARYPYYTGIDVSSRAIDMCRARFAYAITNYVVVLPLTWWSAGRRGPVSTRNLIVITLPHAVATAASTVVLTGVAVASPPPGATACVGLMLLSYAVYGLVMLAFPAKRLVLSRNLSALVDMLTEKSIARRRANNLGPAPRRVSRKEP